MMTEHDDVRVRIELIVGAAGDVAHGHQQGVVEVSGVVFPFFTDIEKDGSVGLLLKGAKLRGGDLGRKHTQSIQAVQSLPLAGYVQVGL